VLNSNYPAVQLFNHKVASLAACRIYSHWIKRICG